MTESFDESMRRIWADMPLSIDVTHATCLMCKGNVLQQKNGVMLDKDSFATHTCPEMMEEYERFMHPNGHPNDKAEED